MKRVADLEISFPKSPSLDIEKYRIEVTLGEQPTFQLLLGRDDEPTRQITVDANTSGKVRVVAVDSEGLEAASADVPFSVGALDNPLPPGDPLVRIVAVREIEE